MATSYTSLLGLALPVTGELAGTWGDTVNNSITSLLDTAIAGTTTLSTDADVTLTTTTGASNQSRQAILLCSGARTALRTITAPAQSKTYVIINATTGGYSVKIVGVGPTTGVTVANGKTTIVAWNGSDFVEVAPATATTATSATNIAGGAAGSVPYQSGAAATTFLSIGTANQVLQVNSGATAPEWVSSTGTGNVVRATSPTLTTPTLGVASATTINKVTLTAPATGSTLTIADGKTFTVNNTVTLSGTDSTTMTLPTATTTLVGTDSTQTLTNKRVTPRITSITDAATITPASDTSDQYNVTALAQAATIASPSGTPTDGQGLILRIDDNGTARGLTWTTGVSGSYRAVGVTLPTTTVLGKTMYAGCIYNSAKSRWDVVAIAQEA